MCLYTVQKRPYAVVVFLASEEEDESTDVVPACWLTPKKTQCYWPPVKPGAITRLVRQLAEPAVDWPLCNAHCLTFCGKV